MKSWWRSCVTHVCVSGFQTDDKAAIWTPACRVSWGWRTSWGASAARTVSGVQFPQPNSWGTEHTPTHTSETRRKRRDLHKLVFVFTHCRSFLAIRDTQTPTDYKRKSCLLTSFKDMLSVQAPEFRDQQQQVSQLIFLLFQLLPIFPLCTNYCCVAVCLGRSRVSNLSHEPHTESGPSAFGLCIEHWEDKHLPCWGSPGVQDGERQDLQEVKLQNR